MAKNWADNNKRISNAELKKLWQRWRAGENLSQIGKALAVTHSAVRSRLLRSGGIAMPQRARSTRVLSLTDREEISRGLARQESLRSIARRLGRSPTIVATGDAPNVTFTLVAANRFTLESRVVETKRELERRGIARQIATTAVNAVRAHVGTQQLASEEWLRLALAETRKMEG